MSYTFERFNGRLKRSVGRPSNLEGMQPKEIRTFTQDRHNVRQWLRQRHKSHPKERFSWATENGVTAVRRDA